MTEAQLLEQTASVLGVSLAQLVRAGALVYAKREFLNNRRAQSAGDGDAQTALLRSGSGVAGVADARIAAAFDALALANAPITPAKLATRALTGYPTALRWLKIHHPELLAPRPLPAAPSPEEGPKPEAKAPQEKPPQAATGKRGRTAKVQKPPKRISSPKEHPELPMPDSQARKAPAGLEPISIVPFREFSLPGSHRVALAYGALDTKGAVYFSAETFGQGVLDEAIRASSSRTAAQHINLIAHQDHHLVPISWLMIQVPRHQPFLKRAQNHIRKEGRPKPAKRVRDPEVEPF